MTTSRAEARSREKRSDAVGTALSSKLIDDGLEGQGRKEWITEFRPRTHRKPVYVATGYITRILQFRVSSDDLYSCI